jgi:hypothetical protein
MIIDTQAFSLKSSTEPLDKALIILRLSLNVSLGEEEMIKYLFDIRFYHPDNPFHHPRVVLNHLIIVLNKDYQLEHHLKKILP